MREVIFRPDAEADIEDVTDYTIEQWGLGQARTYIRELRCAIELLATTALRHPIHDNVYPSLRRKRSEMHHIYYLVSQDIVDVLNVIHVQSDPGLHLRAEAWRNEEN